jgi:hypothetical protein
MSWLPLTRDPNTLAETISISIRTRIAQGKIVCRDIAGNEGTLRWAIAALGPEFALGCAFRARRHSPAGCQEKLTACRG